MRRQPAYFGGDFSPREWPERLAEPLSARKPQVILVSFMGDLFDPAISDEFILKVFLAIAEAPVLHTYLMLTKRPERMRQFLNLTEDWDPSEWPQVWLGVTAEDQATADERIPILLDTPAAHRWVSVEPMLGAVDIGWALGEHITITREEREGAPEFDVRGIDWVVAGCESGPKRRPAKDVWFRSLRDQCEAAGVPYYLKQKEEWAGLSFPRHNTPCGVGKVVKAPELDGVVHDATGWR